jgi:hypothetical protein
MKLGENILKLRKQNGLSQEQLGEQVGVTRQTISNWELNETTPNPEQLKLLSKALNVSIDELLDNDVKNVVIEKVSNTERLAGIIIKILKVFAVLGIIYVILIILGIILFKVFPNENVTTVNEIKSATLNCSIKDNNYTITIGDDNYFDCPECNKEMNVYLKDITDWANIDHSIENIEKYFKDNGGTCED